MSNQAFKLPVAGKKREFFYGRIILLAAFFIMVFAFGSFFSFGVFLKPMLIEFGWTRAATSAAYSLSLLVGGTFGILTGRLNDRFGPRVIITGGGLLAGLGLLLMSQIGAIWQLYLSFGVMSGIGRNACYVATISTVARWFVKRRGLMTGIVVSGIGVGILVMPPVVGQLISALGWRTSCIIMATTVLAAILIAAQFLKRDPFQVGQFPDGDNKLKQEGMVPEVRGFALQEAIHTRQFWMLCVVFFGFGLSIDAVLLHIVPHVTDLGISARLAAAILAIAGGISIAGRIGIGSVCDRAGTKQALAISLVLLSIALFWLVKARELWMLYLFAIIYGLGYGGAMALMSPIVADLFGLSSHGAIYAMLIFTLTIGASIGSFLAGRAFDIMGSYQSAFLGIAVFSIISLTLASLLKRPRPS